MKKRISFNVIIHGADGPTAACISVNLHLLLIAAAAIIMLFAGIGMMLKKSK